MNAPSGSRPPQRRLGRSILALLAGFVLGAALSVGTDIALHKAGLAPALTQVWPSRLLLLATAYRTVYSVLAGYVIARLAPNRPMGHALVGGAVGFVLSTLGAIAAWNSNLGPHWYPATLALIALPTAWIGGKIRLTQLQTETAPA